MKAFLKKHKSQIIKLLLALVVYIVIGLVVVGILALCGVVRFENGSMSFNTELFASFRDSWYGWLVFLIMQCVLTTLLCVLPGTTVMFIALSMAIYEEPWQAFLLSMTGAVVSSMLMYLTGRLGGYKLCEKILGEEDCKKAMELLRNRGTVYFPLMMLFPAFPDDALVMLAGTTGMKMKWFVPSVLLGRSFGIATIVFGVSIVPFETFTGLYDWLVFITVVLVWVVALFYGAFRLNRVLEKRRNQKADQADADGQESDAD